VLFLTTQPEGCTDVSITTVWQESFLGINFCLFTNPTEIMESKIWGMFAGGTFETGSTLVNW
jgi:hypothetical protein